MTTVRPELERDAVTVFRRQFESEPEHVVWAPGRLELLGNHTDYNDGYVLSVALELGICAAVAPLRAEVATLEIWSETFRESARIAIDGARPVEAAWSNYPVGVLQKIAATGSLPGGLRMAVVSDLPLGAGVSSSAALELCTAEAAYVLHGARPVEPMDVARLCQQAEAEFVGVPCGILDQFSSLFGRKGHALFLDCRSLEYERLPLGGDDVALVIADSGVKHALVDGQYRKLREHCEAAARRCGELLDRRVNKLRDVQLDDFLSVAERIDRQDRRRAEHVLRENARVLRGREALRRGKIEELGRLMVASHGSSRDLFGNSCAELDFLIREAEGAEGFVGGKLSGGGFGGSTVHLVGRRNAASFVERLESAYGRQFHRPLRTFITRAGDGASSRRLS
ncbi:MAG: galactokinase [Planctomycetota bacterium]|nr:galactokinase [Planctomycetota bacterium]